MKFKNYPKKGLSGVVTSVILIALVMVATAIVWVFVRNLVEEKLEDSGNCMDIFGKVSLNNRYTCYNSSSSDTQFSISIGDINVDEVLISISEDGTTKSFKISNEEKEIVNLANYKSTGFGTDQIKLPGKNAGLTYVTNAFLNQPDLIEIAPIINGKQCGVSDSLSEIDNCLSLI